MSDNLPAAPTRESTKRLKDCKTLQEAMQTGELRELVSASVPKHLTGDRLLRTFTSATSKNPLLLQCEMRGLIGQFLTLSALGLEINTPLGHSYLIPFKTRRKVGTAWQEVYEAQLVIGYKGMVDLAFRSGLILSVDADVVMKGDEFRWHKGTNGGVSYRQMVPKSTGTPTHGYANASVKGGGQPFEVMMWEDIMAIREGSQGYRAAMRAHDDAIANSRPPPKSYTEAPWIKHVNPMACKTVFNQLAKWLPLSPEQAAAVAIDEASSAGRMRFDHVIDEAGNPVEAAMDGFDEEIAPDTAYTDRRDPTPPPAQEQKPAAATPRPAAAKPAQAKPAPAARQAPPAEEAPPDERWGVEPVQEQQTASQPDPVPTPEPVEWFYLTDENGEAIEGPEAVSGTAVLFAERFIERWRKAAPGVRQALIEQNADPIDDARKASREAVDILSEIERAPEPDPEQIEQQEPALPALVAVEVPKTDTGVPHLSVYMGRIKNSLNNLESADRLLEWIAINSPYYASFPRATKTTIQADIDRMRGLLAPDNPDMVSAHGIVQGILAARSDESLVAVTKSNEVAAFMSRWKTERPDLYRRIYNAAERRQSELKGHQS